MRSGGNASDFSVSPPALSALPHSSPTELEMLGSPPQDDLLLSPKLKREQQVHLLQQIQQQHHRQIQLQKQALCIESDKERPELSPVRDTPSTSPSTACATLSTTSTATTDAPKINPFMKSERIKLNVGGKVFETTLQTLGNYPNSLLGTFLLFLPTYPGTMFQPRNRDIISADNDSYFFDRNGKIFEKVLEFYRTGTVDWNPEKISLSSLQAEFDYFQLPEALNLLKEKVKC